MAKHRIVSHKNMNLPCFRLPCTPMSKYDSFLSKIAVRLGELQSTLISSPQTTKSILILYTLTSVSKFCILFSIHFLGYWQGEFVLQSRVSLVSWYFLFSHDPNVWFRSNAVGRNKRLITVRDYSVELFNFWVCNGLWGHPFKKILKSEGPKIVFSTFSKRCYMTKSFKQFLYKVVHPAFLIIFVFFLMLFYSSYVPHTKTKLNAPQLP